MKLSKRLQCIADLVPEDSNVVDVGCDHGLLSIYLAQEKNCKCLATDINSNALNSAKINIKKYNCNNVELKVTDGLKGINLSNNDYIIIAGMGTTTIKHILSDTLLSDNLVIASNNQISEVRSYIIKLGFKIVNEVFVEEHQRKYVIMKFIKGNKKYSKVDIQYGPFLKNNLLYLAFELQKKLEIKEKISGNSFLAKKQNDYEILKLKRLIKKIEEK